MHLFGYSKWERFEWVILRVKKSVSKKVFEENIFFDVNNNTWWRPKKDIFFTDEILFDIIEKCDQRKKEIVDLKSKLNKNILNIKSSEIKNDQTNKKEDESNLYSKKINILKDKNYFLLFWFFLIAIFLLFVLTLFKFNNYYYDSELKEYINFFKKELEKQDQLIQKSQQVLSNDNLIDKDAFIYDKEIDLLNKKEEIYEYIKKWWEKIYFYDMNLNPRSEFTRSLTWEALIYAYFEFWNNWLYRDACSLLNKSRCYSWIKTNLSSFSNFWTKTLDWHEVLEIKKISEGLNSNRYCVKYKYDLIYDTNRESIIETFNFTTNIIWEIEEINSRFCEKIEKNWKEIPCPFELNKYYCR